MSVDNFFYIYSLSVPFSGVYYFKQELVFECPTNMFLTFKMLPEFLSNLWKMRVSTWYTVYILYICNIYKFYNKYSWPLLGDYFLKCKSCYFIYWECRWTRWCLWTGSSDYFSKYIYIKEKKELVKGQDKFAFRVTYVMLEMLIIKIRVDDRNFNHFKKSLDIIFQIYRWSIRSFETCYY